MIQKEHDIIYGTEAAKIFTKVVKGVNFITPIVLNILKVKNHIIEISTNKRNDIIGKVYGITVITKNENDNWFHDNKLCKCVDSYQKALDYIYNL